MSRWSLRAERGSAGPWIAALFAALLVCGAVALGNRPLPPLSFTSGTADYVITVSLPDDRAGTVTVGLAVERRHGRGVIPPITVQAVEPALGHATPLRRAQPVDGSTFAADGVHLMSPGRWRLLVTVAGAEPVVFPLAVTG